MICNTCICRRWRLGNPYRKAWLNIKASAKRRGHTFTLSYDCYFRLAMEAGYIPGDNRQSEGLCLDRKDRKKGYTDDNVQFITMSANSIKEYEDRQREREERIKRLGKGVW